MEYRKLPRGGDSERFSALGLGLGGIQHSSDREIESVVGRALDAGINYFDLCAAAEHVYAPFGRAIAGRRENVFFQLHLGAVYNADGEYGWSRDAGEIDRTLERELRAIGTDYIDMCFLHCVDEADDIEDLRSAGIIDRLLALRDSGTARHIGFSSHTPSVASKLIDMGLADMMMFSINPAYDFGRGDELGSGTSGERAELFRRCAAEGVGISVMKAFQGGKLLDAASSPFRTALTKYQCLQYALDRPGVLTVLPGVRGMSDLEELLGFDGSPELARDYSAVGGFTASDAAGSCVYCNHCQPCPAGIDVGLVNKYYDLSLAGDVLAAGHYGALKVNASDCVSCGHCDERCPFGVAQSERMGEIAGYFKTMRH